MPQVKHTCQNPDCSKTFMAYKSLKRKYCGKKCAGRMNWKDCLKGNGEIVEVNCDLCDKLFLKKECDLKKTKHNYCRREHFYIHRRIRKKVKYRCDYCGEKASTTKAAYKLRNNHYCDKLCSGRAKRTYTKRLDNEYKSILTIEEYERVYRKIRDKRAAQKKRDGLSHCYIKDLIKNRIGSNSQEIPDSFINFYRARLKLKREIIKQHNHE